MKTDIKSLTLEALTAFIGSIGEKPFRAKQIFGWIHQKHVTDFENMTNLSKPLRDKLNDNCYISQAVVAEKRVSNHDNSIKYLLDLGNNTIIECVLMKYTYGNSMCVSSQAGCKMGCTFCASTIHGLERNLSAGEILSQIYVVQDDIGERISNIVIMGSGEPLDNFHNILSFLEIVNCEEGINIGQRHITLSTCGIIDKIYELANLNLQITLAVSLHAPNDEIRSGMMPVSKKYPIDALFEAARFYGNKTKRRVTFEYALIDGVNDMESCAIELSQRLRGTLSHVNLIPINEIKESQFKKSAKHTVDAFADILNKNGVEATIRRKIGGDIDAACGQLRNRYIGDTKE